MRFSSWIRYLTGVGVSLGLLGLALDAHALTLAERLSGRILLQVQSRGEAWYVDPLTKQRFYLGTAADAFALLRSKGLGIRHADFVRFHQATRFPARLSGRILIDVDDRGQAYYILPTTGRALRLGTAEETYQVLRQAGLGIRTEDLQRIPAASVVPPFVPIPLPSPAPTEPLPTPTPSPAPFAELEQRTHLAINQHRESIELSSLIWDDRIAEVARAHSQNMATGRVAFGHDGFEARFSELNTRLSLSRMAENVAANTYPDSVATAVQGWLNSPGHRTNIENGTYTHTGIGVAKNGDEYFFTQLFATLRTR